MTEHIRKLVSGNKARFKDPNLKLELDLVYITDNVIIMGYPASGVEGLYRNRREDAKKFLEHRHGKNYWIFNFCPIRENSYDKQFFDGHVSRYPFPDHHAPPLAIMPLVAREMRAWQSGSSERVSVLHCKAGKGRSGTMACTYLLSLEEDPSPPKLASQHLTAKEWAERRAANILETVPGDNEVFDEPASLESTPKESLVVDEEYPQVDSPAELSREGTMNTTTSTKSFPDSLKTVLDLHSAQRMKSNDKKKSSKNPPKQRQGVSIPSQRRFLSYWSLLLGGQQPLNFWKVPSSTNPDAKPLPPKARITEIKVRLKEGGNLKFGLVYAANTVLDRLAKRKSGKAKKNGENPIDTSRYETPVWASLARYDDDLVELLESWERHTRSGDGAQMGIRKNGSDYKGEDALAELFDPPSGSKWDHAKMVRSFARMGMEKGRTPTTEKDEAGKTTWTYPLRHLSDERWEAVKTQLEDAEEEEEAVAVTAEDMKEASVPASEGNSMLDLTVDIPGQAKGVIVNAHREVRIKLYYGRVFIGWCWFIPAFHMPPQNDTNGPTKLLLARKDLDFALGIGKDIIDVEVQMEWASEKDPTPARSTTEEEKKLEGMAGEGTSKAGAAIQAAVQGDGLHGVREAVEAGQAVEN